MRRGTLGEQRSGIKMCRALKILCAATTAERLGQLKRATVSVQWELVGGATTVDEVSKQIEQWNPDVLVVDKDLGDGVEAPARRVKETLRLVVIEVSAVDPADLADSIKQRILGLPQPGGPVRT